MHNASLHELVQAGAQFLIATHSPILLAYPDAMILECGARGLQAVQYEDTEHCRVSRDFLNRYSTILRPLLGADEEAI